MTSLNIAHAFYLVILAFMIGSLSLITRRKIILTEKERKNPGEFRAQATNSSFESQRTCPSILPRIILGYAYATFAIAAVLLLLIFIESVGMGNAIGPIVEALSKVERNLAC
jgi:hypothetical protein